MIPFTTRPKGLLELFQRTTNFARCTNNFRASNKQTDKTNSVQQHYEQCTVTNAQPQSVDSQTRSNWRLNRLHASMKLAARRNKLIVMKPP